jgi:hypothetical protein
MKKIFKKLLIEFAPALTWRVFARSQNDNEEANYLVRLCEAIDAEKSFVEFGFGVFEFNSVGLAKKKFKGLLIDGSKDNCSLANKMFKKLKLPINSIHHWIELGKLHPIEKFIDDLNGNLGVLNVDVDGNDYWILKDLLLKCKPDVICVEHNASFGLRPISVPYKPDFDRHEEHQSGWYHGASISAFYRLLEPDYGLVKNIAGLNLVFVRKDKLINGLNTLSANQAWTEPLLRNKLSSTTSEEQWQTLKHLIFEEIS